MRGHGISEVLQIVASGVGAAILVMLVTVGPYGRLEAWPFAAALIAAGVTSFLVTLHLVRKTSK